VSKFAKGLYEVKNKEKYIGQHSPTYRSSWENSFMLFLDNHTSVLQWASEPISIGYRDPLSGKTKRYFPDFLMIYLDAQGNKHAEIIEIKPSTQTGQKKTKSAVNNAQILKNQAKWSACMAYCEKNGLQFRILTEIELFGLTKGKR
jgi:hypothetical protein